MLGGGGGVCGQGKKCYWGNGERVQTGTGDVKVTCPRNSKGGITSRVRKHGKGGGGGGGVGGGGGGHGSLPDGFQKCAEPGGQQIGNNFKSQLIMREKVSKGEKKRENGSRTENKDIL